MLYVVLSLIFGVFILLGALAIDERHDRYDNCRWLISWGLYTFCAAIVLLGLSESVIGIAMEKNIGQEKITYLQQTNEEFESRIPAIVEKMIAQEKAVFGDVTPENVPNFIVMNFPELKSNELISRELDIYVSNRDEIKNLELSLIKSNWSYDIFFKVNLFTGILTGIIILIFGGLFLMFLKKDK